MKAVAIMLDGSAVEIENDYETIKATLDGWLEIAPLSSAPFVLLCDEEGKIKGKATNVRATRLADKYRNWEDPLAGVVVLVGLPDQEGEHTEFTLSDLEPAEAVAGSVGDDLPSPFDVKEQMIWREDHGLDGSYPATVDAMLDAADHARKAERENR